jgi:hypothetical protein
MRKTEKLFFIKLIIIQQLFKGIIILLDGATDRLLGLGDSLSIRWGFSNSPHLCFVLALSLDHPSSVLTEHQIEGLHDLPDEKDEMKQPPYFNRILFSIA